MSCEQASQGARDRVDSKIASRDERYTDRQVAFVDDRGENMKREEKRGEHEDRRKRAEQRCVRGGRVGDERKSGGGHEARQKIEQRSRNGGQDDIKHRTTSTNPSSENQPGCPWRRQRAHPRPWS